MANQTLSLAPRRILVTGGAGFLGRRVVELLRARGCSQIHVPRSTECDLTDARATARYFEQVRPEVVLHLAARVGGIGANQRLPGTFFHDNMAMGLHVLEQCRRLGVAKTLLVGTICAYPKFAPIPFREDDLWSGYPEETNAAYGVAKRALLVMADAYRQQHGMRTVCLLPVNLYGPRDNFDLETSHVIPAMIRKFVEGAAQRASRVVLWGDGTPTREFLYVDDCAEALLLAAERHDGSAPINVGAGLEISMRELARLIAERVGYAGETVWDASRPNGQPRRTLDTARALASFGFAARTPLDEGLAKTIAWYRASQPV